MTRDGDVEEQLLQKNADNRNVPIRNDSNTNQKERPISEDIDNILSTMSLTQDTTCGYWIFKGSFFQRFANQSSYVVLYGLVGCIFTMTYAYFNGTITTIEKRFKIPSKNTGIISIGNNISQMLVSAAISYYAGKGHRPRWIGFGIMTIVMFCWLTATPHFLYGAGEDALALTYEYGEAPDPNATLQMIEIENSKHLCKLNDLGKSCAMNGGNFAPQAILFTAQFISGLGGALYYTLGISYMDDNTKKSQSPAMLSISYFIHMLGPAAGYALASIILRTYIAPQLTPFITQKDPRWLGAWWIGWLIIGGFLFFFGVIVSLFPKELPRAAARRIVEATRKKTDGNTNDQNKGEIDEKASFGDMMRTFKSLFKNKTYMWNTFSSIFYLFGYTPYWIFTPKYIEIQYRQSASVASMVTGTVALVFSAIGILASGFIISKYKPKARYLAAWNVIVGFLTVGGIVAYAFIGCPGNEQSVIVNIHDSSLNNTPTCNSACKCDYIPYSPVCGVNNMTYISACHAGCTKTMIDKDGKKTYADCSCIPANTLSLSMDFPNSGTATPGSCPVNCFTQFAIFLSVMCFIKLIFSSGRASNFLVSVRCVPEKHKSASMGLGMMLVCLLTFIPSPIFFGWLFDRMCLVWGKTCTNKGNCWLYDPESLRYTLNITAAFFLFIGTLFDCVVWYLVKDLQIFDEKPKEMEMQTIVPMESKTEMQNANKNGNT